MHLTFRYSVFYFFTVLEILKNAIEIENTNCTFLIN